MGEAFGGVRACGWPPAKPLVVGVNLAYLRPGEMGGSEVYLREVIERASRLDGVSFVLFCSRPAAHSFDSSDRIRIVELSRRRFSQLSRLWDENIGLAFALKRNPVDLIWSPANFVGVALASRRPQVATIHDLQHRLLPDNYSRFKRLSREVMFRLTFRRARKLIAISDFTRDGLLSLYRLPPEKVVAVLSGVATAHVPSAQESQLVIARYGVRQPYLFYPASMDPHKGHLFLLQVFARVKGRVPDLRLVFSGRRSDVWGEVVREADRLGVAADVTHLGFVARSDVFGLMRGAAVVPFASRFEGFGLPLLEAMQCGIPVVAAATTAIPEVAGSGAVLLPPDDQQSWADAIVEILTDTVTRDRLIAAGSANVTRFSWDRCARETIAVLRRSAEADCEPMS